MEKGTTEITDMVFSETNEVREEEEKVSVEAEAETERSGGEEEEKKSNGIINSLISNLVAPLSPKVRDIDSSSSSSSLPHQNNGRGIFNTLVSGILHHTDGGDGDGGGGGDSDLPATSLADPDDGAAIATDEASILIHSIVHD